MANNLCIDPHWQTYDDALQIPMSQALEGDSLEAAEESGETPLPTAPFNGMLPVSSLGVNRLWQDLSSQDSQEDEVLAGAVALVPLTILWERLSNLYHDDSEFSRELRVPSRLVSEIHVNLGSAPTPRFAVEWTDSGDRFAFHARLLGTLVDDPSVGPEHRETIRTTAIQLLLWSASYYEQAGTRTDPTNHQAILNISNRAFAALTAAESLLNPRERAELYPPLTGLLPKDPADLGGMLRELRRESAQTAIAAARATGKPIPPKWREWAGNFPEGSAWYALQGVMHALIPLERDLAEGRPPVDAIFDGRMAAAKLGYQTLHSLTEGKRWAPTDPRETSLFPKYVESAYWNLRYHQQPSQEAWERSHRAALSLWSALGEQTSFETVNPDWILGLLSHRIRDVGHDQGEINIFLDELRRVAKLLAPLHTPSADHARAEISLAQGDLMAHQPISIDTIPNLRQALHHYRAALIRLTSADYKTDPRFRDALAGLLVVGDRLVTAQGLPDEEREALKEMLATYRTDFKKLEPTPTIAYLERYGDGNVPLPLAAEYRIRELLKGRPADLSRLEQGRFTLQAVRDWADSQKSGLPRTVGDVTVRNFGSLPPEIEAVVLVGLTLNPTPVMIPMDVHLAMTPHMSALARAADGVQQEIRRRNGLVETGKLEPDPLRPSTNSDRSSLRSGFDGYSFSQFPYLPPPHERYRAGGR